ncbi:glutaredoxin family protein [Capsulimonas corticalis]|uniref:Glutaredoxin family protein n=1 Tax=Capsulimonas corticalis TaxID=2219043 RepID=A0A402CS63_9BACT|nr:glutaredoxin family protein [Capsulimonas corticalis]BDI28273.1 glutaredoxin family protein [Capsulimonas corticalis]
MSSITLYSKPGCHLCDEALDVLLAVQRDIPFTLTSVNINDDPALTAEYGEQIPVVSLDGRVLFEYEVNDARLRELLKGGE